VCEIDDTNLTPIGADSPNEAKNPIEVEDPLEADEPLDFEKPSRRLLTRRFFATAALWLLLLCGCATRFIGQHWDGGFHLHPDERFLTMVVPQLQWPDSIYSYFDTDRAPLNPLNQSTVGLYVYGQLPLVIVKAAADLIPSPTSSAAAPRNSDNYDDLLTVGRFLSAAFDCGSVALLLAIGWRLGGRYLGFLAAIFLAFMPLHIQHAHFFVVDTFCTFFLLASFLTLFLAIDRTTTRPGNWLFAIAGLCWGAAMACKISSVLFAVVVVISLVAMRPRPASRLLTAFLLVFAVGFLTFRVANPMAFAGKTKLLTMGGILDIRPSYPQDVLNATPQLAGLQRLHLISISPRHTFWSSLREQAGISSGEADPPFNIQWVGRRDYIYPLCNLALWAVGLPIMLPALTGILLAGFASWKRRCPWPLQASALWCLFVFLYYGHWFSKFSRYYLIVTPFLALCAAWFLLELIRACRAAGTWTRAAGLGLTALLLAAAISWGAGWTTIYTRTNTRVAASQWIEANLPPGTPVANETAWDDGLPLGNPHGLNITDLALFDSDTPQKRDALFDKLDHVEWIFVTSNRAWGSIPRLPRRWPLTTAYYHALFDGKLQFAPVLEFSSYPGFLLPGYFIPVADDSAEEAMTVYDHPRVVLFLKESRWSLENAELILPTDLVRDTEQVQLPELRAQGWRPDEKALPQLPHQLH